MISMTYMFQKQQEIISQLQDKVLYQHVIFSNPAGKKMNNRIQMKNHKTFHLFQEKIVEAHHKKLIEKYFKLIKKCLIRPKLKRDRLNFPKEAVLSSTNLIIQTIISK